MNVFAQFVDEELSLRLNTIIQFGNSWEPFAAVWLFNPGSSSCQAPVSEEEKLELRKFENTKEWSRASIDPTMRFLKKLLKREYLGESIELHGVVRLFNLFNLREKNMGKAIQIVQQASDMPLLITIEEDASSASDIDNVYLGWGNSGKTVGKEYANRVFSLLSERQKGYCNSKFIHNPFYHPRYINLSYSREWTQKWLKSYYDANK